MASSLGGDGENGLVEDPHQHPLVAQAGKSHPDRLFVGGAGDAQPGLRIVLQRVAGKVERYYGGVQPAPLDRLHGLFGVLHNGDTAAT